MQFNQFGAAEIIVKFCL